ncbi:UNVERIFIED_CONTAM: hypothetical protein HHA_210478 [Hammondia hammondi]|eukprot:XP_008888625.1 hypothetical protein HHA_210478 [Hammondia hammondi]
MLACGFQDANAIAQATYTLTRLLSARKELRLARKYVRSAVARVEELMGTLMQQSESGMDPCLTASLDPLPYLLEEETSRDREQQETLFSRRSSDGAVLRTRRGASSDNGFANFEGDGKKYTDEEVRGNSLHQEKKWGQFVLQCASLLVMLYDLSLKLDLELGEHPESEDRPIASKEKGVRAEDAAKAEQTHAEKLMRRQLQEMGNVDLSPLENHLLSSLGSNPYRLCLFWCRLSESRRVNAQQILSLAVRELESAVATEKKLVHAGWLYQTDDPAATPTTSRPPTLVGRSCTSLSLSMPATRKNVMSQDAFITLFGGKVAGSGISVTKLHTELLHTGFRHPPHGIVHISDLTPNTKYHFACEEHIDSRKSLPLSETTPDFGTYYPLPTPLLWLHILSSAQKLGIKNITKICWENLWSLFCETTRVSPTLSGHTLCHFKPFIAERQSPYVLDAFAQAICAKYARVPLAASLSGSQQEGRREQERRQYRASRVLIAVEASSIACNYTCLFCAVAAYDALLRPLLCLHTLPPLLLGGLVKCLLPLYTALKTACCVPRATCAELASRATFEETEVLLHSAVAAVVLGGERDTASLRALLRAANEEDFAHAAVLDMDSVRKAVGAEETAKCALAILDHLRSRALLSPPLVPSRSSPSFPIASSFPVAPHLCGMLITLALRKCARQWKGQLTLEFAWLVREARNLLLSSSSLPADSGSPSSRVEGGEPNAARVSPLTAGSFSALQPPAASSAASLSLKRQLAIATDALARFFLDETEALGIVHCDPVEAVYPGGSDMSHLSSPWSLLSLDAYPMFLRNLFSSATPSSPFLEEPQSPAPRVSSPSCSAAPSVFPAPLGSNRGRFLRDRSLQSEELREALAASRQSPVTVWLAEVEVLAVTPLLQLLRDATRHARVESWRYVVLDPSQDLEQREEVLRQHAQVQLCQAVYARNECPGDQETAYAGRLHSPSERNSGQIEASPSRRRSTQIRLAVAPRPLSPFASVAPALGEGEAEEGTVPPSRLRPPSSAGEDARPHRRTTASTLQKSGREENARLSRMSVRPELPGTVPGLVPGPPSQSLPSSSRDSNASPSLGSSLWLSPSACTAGVESRDGGGWSRDSELRLVASVVGHLAQTALLASLAPAPRLLQLCLLCALNALLCSVPSPREIVDFSSGVPHTDSDTTEEEGALKDAPPHVPPASSPLPNAFDVAATSANPSRRLLGNPGAAGAPASPKESSFKEAKREKEPLPVSLSAFLHTAGLTSLLPYGRRQLGESLLAPSDLASGVPLPHLFLQAVGDKTATGLSGGDRRDRAVRQGAGDVAARSGFSVAPRATSGSESTAGGKVLSVERSGKPSVRAKGRSIGGPGYSAFGPAMSEARECEGGEGATSPVESGGGDQGVAARPLERTPGESEQNSGEIKPQESPPPLWVAFGILAQMCVDFLANYNSDRVRVSATACGATAGAGCASWGDVPYDDHEEERNERRDDSRKQRALQNKDQDLASACDAGQRPGPDAKPAKREAQSYPRGGNLGRKNGRPRVQDTAHEEGVGERKGCRGRGDKEGDGRANEAANGEGETDVDLRSIGRLFIFCIQVLTLKSRWHQIVALCIRFNALTGNQFAFALSSYALAAQQQVVALHTAAVEGSKEQLKKAEQEFGSLHGDRRKTQRRSALLGPATRQERLFFHRKKCYDAVLEGQLFSLSLTKAVEAQLRQERVEAGRYEQLLGPCSSGPASYHSPSWASPKNSTDPFPPLSVASVSSPTCVPSVSTSSPRGPAGPDSTAPLKASAVLQAYCLAEGLLRRHQQVDLLTMTLFEKGNLLCIMGKAALAAKAWREAVDAAHRQMDAVLQTTCAESLQVGRERQREPCDARCARPPVGAGAVRGPDPRAGQQPSACGEASYLAPLSSSAKGGSPSSAPSSKETGKKPLVATAAPAPQHGFLNGPQMRLELQSLVPLYFAARIGHFNAIDFHLASALLASQVVRRVLAAAEPHPLDPSRFFKYRSDGKCMRYRMREVYRLGSFEALFADAPGVGGASMQTFLAALHWFAQVLADAQVRAAEAHALFALAEFLSADVCRHVETVTQCRARRAMLLTSTGDLQAAYWQLIAIYQGQDTETTTGIFTRDCLDEMIEPQGSAGPLRLPPSSISSPSSSPSSSFANGISSEGGFLNFEPSRHCQNTRATGTVLALNLSPQQEQLYRRDNTFFFAFARAQWLFTADARMPVCLDAGGQHLAERLEKLAVLENFLRGLVKDILTEHESEPKRPWQGDLSPAAATSIRGPSRLITSQTGARQHVGPGRRTGGTLSPPASAEETTAFSVDTAQNLRGLHLISPDAWEILLRSFLLLARVSESRARPKQAESVLRFAIQLLQRRVAALHVDASLPCILSPSRPSAREAVSGGRSKEGDGTGDGEQESDTERGDGQEAAAEEAREHARRPAPPDLKADVVFPTPELSLQLYLHLAKVTLQLSRLQSASSLVECLLVKCSGHVSSPDLEPDAPLSSGYSLSLASPPSLPYASSALSRLSTKPSFSDSSTASFSSSPDASPPTPSSASSPFALPLPPPLERRKLETVCAPLAVIDLLLLQAEMLLLKGSVSEALHAAVGALDYAERLRLHRSVQYVNACQMTYLLLVSNANLASFLESPSSRRALHPGAKGLREDAKRPSPVSNAPFPESGNGDRGTTSPIHSQARRGALLQGSSDFSLESSSKHGSSWSFAVARPVRGRSDGTGREGQGGELGESCVLASASVWASQGPGRMKRCAWRHEGDMELGEGKEPREGLVTSSPASFLMSRFGSHPRERQGTARTTDVLLTLPLGKRAAELAAQRGNTRSALFALSPVTYASGNAHFSHLAVLQSLLINAIERLDDGTLEMEGGAYGDREEYEAHSALKTVSLSAEKQHADQRSADQRTKSTGELASANAQAGDETFSSGPDPQRRNSLRLNRVGNLMSSSFDADFDAAVIVSLINAVSPSEIGGFSTVSSSSSSAGVSIDVPSASVLTPLKAFISELFPLSLHVSQTPISYPRCSALLSGEASSAVAARLTCPASEGQWTAHEATASAITGSKPKPNLYAPQQEQRLHLGVELVEVLLKKGNYVQAGLLVSDLVPRVGRIAAALPFLSARLGLLHLQTRRLGTDLSRLERNLLRVVDPNLRSPAPILRPSEQGSQNRQWLHQVGKYVGSVLSLSFFIETLCGHDFALLLALYQEGIRGLLTYFLLEEGCQSASAPRQGAFMAIHAFGAAAEETMGLQRKALKGALAPMIFGPSDTEKSSPTSGPGAALLTVPPSFSSLAGGAQQAKDGDRGDKGQLAPDTGMLPPPVVKYLAALASNEVKGTGSCGSTASKSEPKLVLPSLLSCLSSLRGRCALFHSFNREQRAAADYLHMFLFSHCPRYRSLACLSRTSFLVPGEAGSSSDSSSYAKSSALRPPSSSSRTAASSSSSESPTLITSLFSLQTGERTVGAHWNAFIDTTLHLGWYWLPSVPFDAPETAVFDPATRQWTLCSPLAHADSVILLVCARGKKPLSVTNPTGALAPAGVGDLDSRAPAPAAGRVGKGEKPDRPGSPVSLASQSRSSSLLSSVSKEKANNVGTGAGGTSALASAASTDASGSCRRAGGTVVGKSSKEEGWRRPAPAERRGESVLRKDSTDENSPEGTVYVGHYSRRRLLNMSKLFKKLCRQVRQGGRAGALTRSQTLELSGSQVPRDLERWQEWAVEDSVVSYRVISNTFYRFFLLLNDGLIPRTVSGDGADSSGASCRARRRAWIECPTGAVFTGASSHGGGSGEVAWASSSSFRPSPVSRPFSGRSRSSGRTSAHASSLGAGSVHSFSSSTLLGSRRGVWGTDEMGVGQSRGGALEFLQDLDHGDFVRAHAARRSQATKAVQQLWSDLRVLTQEQAAATQTQGAATEQGKTTKSNKRVNSASPLAASQRANSGTSTEAGTAADQRAHGSLIEGVSDDVLYGVLLACADLANPVYVASTRGKEPINRFLVSALAPCAVTSVGGSDSCEERSSHGTVEQRLRSASIKGVASAGGFEHMGY